MDEMKIAILTEKVKNLEDTVHTLILWLGREFGKTGCDQLIDILNNGLIDPAEDK